MYKRTMDTEKLRGTRLPSALPRWTLTCTRVFSARPFPPYFRCFQCQAKRNETEQRVRTIHARMYPAAHTDMYNKLVC